MNYKFHDIPFLRRTMASDFSCKDGELLKVENARVLCGGEILKDESFNEDYISATGATLPPVPDISFGLVRSVLPGWHLHPDNYPTQTLVASEPSMEYWTKLASQLLTLFQSEAIQKNLFISPFLAMAAWKSSGGSYLSHSLPALLIPNSDVPLVATDADIDKTELEFRIAGAVCSLYFKMEASEILRDWIGKIASLEILVSSPLHSYDSFSAFLPQHRLTTDSWCRLTDISTGEVTNQRICTDTLPLAWKARLKETTNLKAIENNLNEISLSALKFHPFLSMPLSEVDRFDKWTSADSLNKYPDLALNSGKTLSELKASTIPQTGGKEVVIEGTGEALDMETRPLKLSGAGILKKLSRIRLRGAYNPSYLTISVMASRDMLQWWCVAKRKGATVIAVPTAPFRFFKVKIEGILPEGYNLQGLSLEFSL